MRKLGSFSFVCIFFCCLMISTERRAYAYVDPGSSLFLLQGISSTVLGILFFFRRKLTFGKRKMLMVGPIDVKRGQ